MSSININNENHHIDISEYFSIHYCNKRTGETHLNPCFQTLEQAYGQFAVIHKSVDYIYWVGPSEESGKDQSIYMKMSSDVYDSKTPLQDLNKLIDVLDALEILKLLEI